MDTKRFLMNKVTDVNALLSENNAPFTVEFKETYKNNLYFYGFMIKDGTNISPIIYHSNWEELSTEDIVDYLILKYGSCNTVKPDIENIISFQYIKDNVLPELRPVEDIENIKNEDLIYTYDDNSKSAFVITYKITVKEMSDDSGTATIKVKRYLLDRINMSTEDLYHFAFQNLADQTYMFSMNGLFNIPCVSEDNMFVVTTKSSVMGAISILNPSIQESLEDKLGSVFYLLPSSVHEFIAVTYSELNAETLKTMIKEVNSTVLDPIDKFSDNLYLYKKGVITICE